MIFFLLPLVFSNLIIFYKKSNRNHMGFAGNDGLYISESSSAAFESNLQFLINTELKSNIV